MTKLQRNSERHRLPRVLDNQVRVSTPENISFQYEVVGPSRRLFAYLLDVFFTLSAFTLAALLTTFLFGLLRSLADGTALGAFLEVLSHFAVTIFLVSGFFSLWFYGAWMEANYNGQTWGKMLANIRALSADGSAIDGTQATLRNFFRLLDVAPYLPLSVFFGAEAGAAGIPIFGFGLLSMTVSRKYQRLGDFVANTMVVSESRKRSSSLVRFQDARVPKLAGLIPYDFVVSSGLAKALAEYVDRRRVLPQQRLNEVANHIGTPLIRRFGLPADTNSDLLLCALYYRTFVQDAEPTDGQFPMKAPLTSPGQAARESVPVAAEAMEVSP